MDLLRNRRKQAASTEPSIEPSLDVTSLPSISGSMSPPEPWEEVDISSTDYARRRRELMEMMADLRSMGADALIALPSVVVIGGQSAGKSSLVEAVSGINVPRDSGTCTRCPMECNMSSHAKSWSCTITLRIGFDSNGLDLQKPTNVLFGPTITDRSEFEVWLRRAQAAILNPNVASSTFHAKTVEELKNIKNTLKFSRNVVCVSIEDPDATDLSFYDLPGLIQNEEPEAVALVKNLAEHYIEKKNTIILTTIPMSDDMENQQSMSLARAADPNGKRTIGVLTKPDTLGTGAINQRRKWVEIIEGRSEEHTLMHGFYCVRLPDDSERAQRLSRAESQRRAAEYFDTTSPWKDVTERHRFGIPGFVSDISRLLIQLIEETLPCLREDVDTLLAKCTKDFDELPPPLENDPQIEVLGRVNTFCDDFKSFVNGSHEDKSLAQQNRALYAIFKRNIRGTAPDFRPFNDPKGYVPLDDTEGNMTLTERDPGVKVMGIYDIRRVIQEAIGWELPNNVPYQAKANLITQFTKLWVVPSERCLAGVNNVLDQVVDTLISTHFGRFKVLEEYFGNLIRIQVDICRARAKDAVKTALDLETIPHYTQNTHYLQTLRGKWLAHYKTVRSRPALYMAPMAPIRKKHKSSKISDAPSRLAPEDECDDPPPPKDSPSFDKPKSSSIYSGFGGLIETKEGTETKEAPKAKALRALAEAGYAGLQVSDLARLLPPDSFEEELVVMADVRAYFHVAYKRIIDHIPFTIEHALHHALAKQLSQSLLTSLLTDAASGPNFSERMKELVSEDASIAQRRLMLSTRKERLLNIRRRLMTFSNST
ncbi:P-loop containing nucleoside triphosphate hydrolase protein [Suillus fuscotomentosus]|uniref:P-loop containing nucleoside triphosphate hydrolase protein n=1 Tax=Suillus fuscotomentosus TaxID=1912939 RepID=A0AAD4E047_9AGAM|nr:P-loop containing nucleoside triphosphate hydrolase protein [Suillus fuscotomentosus]KAG1896029.1 P-loop containing nucleoside triphosphate hydrolase protein [Suillus fuscotomentosus]